jgi:hypothetical protein
MLVIVEQLREGKLMLVLIGYHYYSVQFYLVQLLVSATMDTAAAHQLYHPYSCTHTHTTVHTHTHNWTVTPYPDVETVINCINHTVVHTHTHNCTHTHTTVHTHTHNWTVTPYPDVDNLLSHRHTVSLTVALRYCSPRGHMAPISARAHATQRAAAPRAHPPPWARSPDRSRVVPVSPGK